MSNATRRDSSFHRECSDDAYGLRSLSKIRIRDPFILADREEQLYYMYGTRSGDSQGGWPRDKNCHECFRSEDLENWEGPFQVFSAHEGFWGTQNFWAPEVYAYRGKYYLFGTFKAPDRCRATHVLVSESPLGPFRSLHPKPQTPEGWECLDGSLFIDDREQAWMIFCREWVEIDDGEMWAQKLSADLVQPIAEPVLLFRASEADWAKPIKSRITGQLNAYVTDGPFIYRTKDGALLMLWSSLGEKGYAMGIARSLSGKPEGPWQQDPEPMVNEDGGHGMLFENLQGQLMLAYHQPNRNPNERARFFPIHEVNGPMGPTLSVAAARDGS